MAFIPTFNALRKTIKNAGGRWSRDLGLLVLVKHESFNGSTASFADKLGINAQRVYFWQKTLKWQKIREKTMAGYHNIDPTDTKKKKKPIAQANKSPVTAVPTKKTQQHTASSDSLHQGRIHVETMIRDLRELSTTIDDGDVKKHTVEACANLGRTLHRMLDLELGIIGQESNGLHTTNAKSNGKGLIAEA